MKNLTLSISIIILLFFASCKGKILNPTEADRSMKILNSNLVNLLSTGSEKPEFKAIAFLLNLENSPLPISKKTSTSKPDTSAYKFEKMTGIYTWNPETKEFDKSVNAETIALHFPENNSGHNNANLILKQYQSEAYSSRPDLPTLIDAAIRINDRQIATIKHEANITNNLPENIHTTIKGTDYEMAMMLKRTQMNTNGTLNINLYLKTKGYKVISGNTDAKIEYSRHGYFFKTINLNLELIDHYVTGNINYAAIDPTSADYIDSFNSNADIRLFEGRDQVGIIVLNKTNDGELLDYFIRFSNGDEKLLSEYLPVLKNLLNLKY
ncbi:MAG: hypothetical protein WC384_02460 [Prolixibacteraceae bacterium]|jgi:hypothetical protein